MQKSLTRRSFCKSSFGLGLLAGVGGLSTLQAREAIEHKGEARLRLSMAAYSFRKYMKYGANKNDKRAPEDKWIDLFQFIDYAGIHGCQGVELTSYYFPPDTNNDFLLKIKNYCFTQGLEISGTSVGNTFTYPPGEKRDADLVLVKSWIDRAALMGAPHIRVFAGALQKNTKEEATRLCIEALDQACDYAGQKGVFLGIENHGGIIENAADLLHIIHSVKSPWLGINLDTANFHTEDPYADFAQCASYAVNVQMKREIQRKGEKKETADLARFVNLLRAAKYQGYIALEYESEEDPYEGVPPLLKQISALLAAA